MGRFPRRSRKTGERRFVGLVVERGKKLFVEDPGHKLLAVKNPKKLKFYPSDRLLGVVYRNQGSFVAERVLERRPDKFVGQLIKVHDFAWIYPIDGRGAPLILSYEDPGYQRELPEDGQLVELKIKKRAESLAEQDELTVCHALSFQESLKYLYEKVVHDYKIETKFSDFVAKELAEDHDISPVKRSDCLDVPLVTIDPATAKDFDDALFAKRLDHGYELQVHIADVSEYVAYGSHLGYEARTRGCSYYLADQVVPMLPEELSNGLCSLQKGEERLSFALKLKLNKAGIVTHKEHFLARVKIRENLSYAAVEAYLQQDSSALVGVDSDVLASLSCLNEICDLLEARSELRGALRFESRNQKLAFSADYQELGYVLSPPKKSERLVELCMILANVEVAKTLHDHKQIAIFRAEEEPSQAQLEDLALDLHQKGLIDEVEFKELCLGKLRLLPEIQKRAELRPDKEALRLAILNSLPKATYVSEPSPHFALALEHYCHFTSPIRRFPDLVVHWQLKRCLNLLTTKQFGRTAELQEHAFIKRLAQAATKAEINATRAEARINDLFIFLYLVQHKVHFKIQMVEHTAFGLRYYAPDFGFYGNVPQDELAKFPELATASCIGQSYEATAERLSWQHAKLKITILHKLS